MVRTTALLACLIVLLGGCFPSQLNQPPQILKIDGSFSPDGEQLLYMSNEDGDFEIYLVDADGTGKRNLTNNDDNESAPSWSPDGQSIVFSSDRSGQWELYLMSIAGGDPRAITGNDGESQP